MVVEVPGGRMADHGDAGGVGHDCALPEQGRHRLQAQRGEELFRHVEHPGYREVLEGKTLAYLHLHDLPQLCSK